jgi:type III restriction enzyme
VLCSLRETRSATAIEQIVGRILRLPQAKLKRHPDLNCAYAFSVSPSIVDVLAELHEALEHNGFTTAEAERIIIPVTQGSLPLGSHPKSIQVKPNEIDGEVAAVQVLALGGKVRIDTASGEITVVVPLDKDETEKLTSCVKSPEAKTKVIEVVNLVSEAERAFGGTGHTRPLSPYEQQLDFFVPLVCVLEDERLFEFDSTFLIEHEWKLSEKDAAIAEYYNPLERSPKFSGVVDIGAKGDVQTSVLENDKESDFIATVHQQVLRLSGGGDWTTEKLIAWLDRHIEHKDISAGESAEFLRKVIRGLMAKFGISDVSALALDRFRLRDEVERRIDQHRATEYKAAFQMYLLPESCLVVSNDRGLNFKTMAYEPSWLYEGSFQFRKHYFGAKPGELREKTPSGDLTEEFKCAQFIDAMSQVKFWVRNLARRNSSFRLQTSTDWFYPDFICQLVDGRVLVVEYKGKIFYESIDAEEKRAVGAVWASRSGEKGLFVMPTDGDFTAITKLLRA